MSASPSALYAWAPDVLTRRVGTNVLVTRLDDPELHELSGGACAVWDELAIPSTLPDLIRRIARSHGVEQRAIDSEVRECLDALLALGAAEARDDLDA